MLDIFLIFNIALIILLAILIYKNKSWKTQPIVVVFFIMVLIAFGLTFVFR